MDKSEKTIIIVILGVVAGCLLIAILCAAIFLISDKFSPIVPTPAMPTQAVCTVPIQESKISTIVDNAELMSAMETQALLANSTIPTADLNKIAVWLNGAFNVPTRLETPPIQYQIGDRLPFNVINENDEDVTISATLRYATENVYFWAQDDIQLVQDDLKMLVDIFSNEIYPTDQAFFGSEWIPGVDNDAHLFILYARDLGDYLAGYTSSTDYVLPQVYPYSNAHEMFYINADGQVITDEYTLSTMAHEFQHVIQGYRDPNEDVWLNEGFSELATLINGYDAGGFDYWFTLEPDMQLNNWSSDPYENDKNYGASYLFTTYFYGRFGETLTKDLINDPLNGFDSLDNVFRNNNIAESSTGALFTAEEIFRDWTLTNMINNADVLDGRYYYSAYPSAPTVESTDWLNECDGTPFTATVNQFGTDYYEIGCDGRFQLKFSGSPTIGILPDNAENPTYIMWSNRGESSDMTLTREFDLTGFSGNRLTLNFDVWYDLETDFDKTYLLMSVNGGDWQLFAGSCLLKNSITNASDCSFSGQSSSWQTQSVDLSNFGGQRVSIRFETVSDGAISKEGFAIDNIKIQEIGYEETFEEGNGGWITEGFSRIRNVVPQTFLVSLISSDPANPIKKYQINAGEELTLLIDPYCLAWDPIVLVSGSSRFTRQLAEYTITLTE